MITRKKPPLTVDELFPSQSPAVENAVAEALQSKLIDAFESALLQGMSSSEALALILAWASSEVNRVCANRNGSYNGSNAA